MKTTQELIDLITLRKLEENLFEGESSFMGSPNVFGGQVVSQALHAAYQTVPTDRFCHSLHSYFILPGDLEQPILYDVANLRDGGSFSTRVVTAKQNNVPIFVMAASFQLKQEGYEHQEKMPIVTPPEELMSWNDVAEQFGSVLPKSIMRFVLAERPLDFKPVEFVNPFEKKDYENFSNVWLTFNDVPDNLPLPIIQQLIAYSSDYNLLSTAIKPHASKAHFGNTQMASLDHSIWFHRTPNLHDWILVNVESPSANDTRGFTRGNLFNRCGEMICSVAQEGLIRPIVK
ncbi:acyl-CoA thioesterase-2 [Algoriella xinjiangensis]|uniref:Acyl-CoA thioesterase 2 n=1 Tax=Algoriella xinjiangensis TaxID=684065 RepID=A0A1I4Y0W9_9FLAO|nr:acyl-CoA thioesterase II [Algoriella xinjiangensis]SFN31768.1 acyl-CoA thioesterase-2 [Algoriella xinjiangensis]VDH15346.1 Acyl-CoA thioesterase 2 [Algoriella xinjiangensis]